MRKILSLLAAIFFAGSMLAAVGNVFYTFVPQKLGSGNVSDYSKSGDQEIDGLTWTVPGNWYGTGALRLGGKSIENVDRSIIGKSAIGDAIAKIVISHAGINSTDLVLNTVKLTVASDAEFSADVETKTLTLNTDYTVEKDKAGTIEFTPAGDFWAKNSYYKFDFNFTNTNSSNRALTLNKIEFYSYSDVEITHWTVAGSSATLFGTTWDPANKDNEMIQQEDGSFKWEKTELELAEGTVAFKVCKNYTWDEAYPAKDYELAIPEGAIYTVTINFNPESKEIAAVATKTGEAVVLPTVVLHGNFFGEWKDTDPFAPAEDKLTARLNLTLAEGNYEFGFKFDGAWKANGAHITREAPTTSLAEGSGNMHFAADAAGEYQLTYTFESQTLEVAYPKKPEVLPEGAFKLTFKGTGTNSDSGSEFKKDGDIFTDDCKALVASVDTISKVYAARVIEDDPSSLKFGTSSVKGYFEFTLATPVEVDSIIVNATQYGDKASEVTVNDVKFDLTAGNKIPQNCKITPEGTISTITIAQTGSERLYVRSVTVYAKGTPTPPEPVKTLPVVALAGTMNGWSLDANIFTPAEDSLTASVKINLEAGKDTFKIVSDEAWLSLNGEGEALYSFHRDWTSASHLQKDLRNFELTADVAGEYTFTWTYADSTIAITFPAKPEPVEENIWKVTEETSVDAEAVYVDNDLLKLNSVFAGTLKPNTRTIAGEEFTHAIQVRVDAWPTEDVKTGTAKEGSTSLILVAKEDIDITLYYNRQTTSSETGAAEENDSKDVWVFDHENISTAITGEFKVDWMQEDKKYVNATKKLALVKGHTYTIAAKGTTLQLHGIKFEAGAPTPADPTAAVTGDMTKWGEPIPFELSEDKKKATLFNDNIKAGTYAFKMIINGEWRSNGYEFHRGFPGCAGITGNTEANMTVIIDVEGAYTFEWYFENDSLAIIFPEKPEPVFADGYYLMGSFNEWAIDAKNLFVANPDAEGEYQLSINLAEGDEIKVAFVEADEAKQWFPKEGNVTIDKNHAGETTMYFRAEYNEAWAAFGGYFYIVPTGTEGIEETLSEGKAVKVLREGNILIMKGNHTYTVMGQIVK